MRALPDCLPDAKFVVTRRYEAVKARKRTILLRSIRRFIDESKNTHFETMFVAVFLTKFISAYCGVEDDGAILSIRAPASHDQDKNSPRRVYDRLVLLQGEWAKVHPTRCVVPLRIGLCCNLLLQCKEKYMLFVDAQNTDESKFTKTIIYRKFINNRTVRIFRSQRIE